MGTALHVGTQGEELRRKEGAWLKREELEYEYRLSARLDKWEELLPDMEPLVVLEQ